MRKKATFSRNEHSPSIDINFQKNDIDYITHLHRGERGEIEFRTRYLTVRLDLGYFNQFSIIL
jgi:hypothetical protein